MIFGLSFTNDSKQQAQFSIDVANPQLWFRVNTGSGWTTWKRADVDRNSNGSITNPVAQADNATRAEKADRLTTPVNIVFTGGVSGGMSIDGSQSNISVNLSVADTITDATNNGAVRAAIDAKMADHIWRYHPGSEP